MYARSLAILLGLGLVAAVGCGEAPVEMTPGLQAFVGARIIDGTGSPAIESGVLVVRDGRIEAVGAGDAVEVPPDAEQIDVGGRTLMPGLINAHGHVNNVRGLEADPSFYTEEHVESQLGLYARYGITTVFSLGGDGPAGVAVRDRQRDNPDLNHARFYLSGNIPTGPTPEEAVGTGQRGDRARRGYRQDPGRRQPRREHQDDTGGLPGGHRHRARTGTCGSPRISTTWKTPRGCLEAGADLLAHSVRDTGVDDELIAQLQRDRRLLLPDPHARGLDLRLRVAARVVRRSVLPERGGPRGRGRA